MSSKIPKFSSSLSEENIISIVEEISENMNISLIKTYLYQRVDDLKVSIYPIYEISLILPIKRSNDENNIHTNVTDKLYNLKSEYVFLNSLYASIKRMEKLNGKLIWFREDTNKYKFSIDPGDDPIISDRRSTVKFLKNPESIYRIGKNEYKFSDFNSFTGTFEIYNGRILQNPPTYNEIVNLYNVLNYSVLVLELKSHPRIGYFISNIEGNIASLELCKKIIIK